MVQPWSFMNFGSVVKRFGSILKKVSCGYKVRSSNGTALVDHELWTRR